MKSLLLPVAIVLRGCLIAAAQVPVYTPVGLCCLGSVPPTASAGEGGGVLGG